MKRDREVCMVSNWYILLRGIGVIGIEERNIEVPFFYYYQKEVKKDLGSPFVYVFFVILCAFEILNPFHKNQ